jgi:hypothetical protein
VTCALAASLSTSAYAATNMTWRAQTLDEETRAPIEGVTVTFNLHDIKSGRKSQQTCVTNERGECGIVAAAAGGGFFSGQAYMNSEYRVSHPDYVEMAKFSFSNLSNGGKLGVALMTTRASVASKEARAEAIEQKAVGEEAALEAELAALDDARGAACKDKAECDKLFALTEIFISQYGAMKIQMVTATTIETHNPTAYDDIGWSAYRVPRQGSAALVMVQPHCGKQKTRFERTGCMEKKIKAIKAYLPFVERMSGR